MLRAQVLCQSRKLRDVKLISAFIPWRGSENAPALPMSQSAILRIQNLPLVVVVFYIWVTSL